MIHTVWRAPSPPGERFGAWNSQSLPAFVSVDVLPEGRLVRKAGVSEDILFGVVAGVAGTAAMTVVMNLLYRRLPARVTYPLPPREITEATLGSHTEMLPFWTITAHFAYGALAASAYSATRVEPRISRGALYGVVVWAGSYLGWIPTVRLLRPAYEHPPLRNGHMILAHLVWGGSVAAVLQSLKAAEREGFGSGQLRDARLAAPSAATNRGPA